MAETNSAIATEPGATLWVGAPPKGPDLRSAWVRSADERKGGLSGDDRGPARHPGICADVSAELDLSASRIPRLRGNAPRGRRRPLEIREAGSSKEALPRHVKGEGDLVGCGWSGATDRGPGSFQRFQGLRNLPARGSATWSSRRRCRWFGSSAKERGVGSPAGFR